MLLSKLTVMNAFLLFLLLIRNASAYRYLMTTLNVAYSHLEFNGRVADLLVTRGHDVDFLLAKVNPFAASNGTSKADVIEFMPSNLQEIGQLISQLPVYDDVFKEDVDVFSPNALPYFKKAAHLFCLALQSDKQLLSRLQEHKYDAALVEDDSCFKVLARRLGIRNLMILTPTALSEMHANALNIPALPSFVPVLNHAPVSPLEMTFVERFWNFYHTMRSIYVVDPQLNELFDEEGLLRGSVLPKDFPKIAEINRDVTAWFVNVYQHLDLPRPISPLLHYVGGIALKDNTGELNKPIQQIYSNAKKGVVVISFGSVVDTQKIDISIVQRFVQAFRQFSDYQFIWKFKFGSTDEQKRLFDQSENVHTIEWLDQTAMLAHPKTRLFVSHLGLNSLNEALHFGVPVLAIPMFCDQTYNSAIVQHSRVGIVLDKRELNVEVLVLALKRLLNDEEFANKAQKIKQMVRNEKKNAPERFLHQVEFATEFADQIKLQSLPNLHLFFYYSLDVLLFLFGSIVFAITVVVLLLSKAFKIVIERRKVKSE